MDVVVFHCSGLDVAKDESSLAFVSRATGWIAVRRSGRSLRSPVGWRRWPIG